MLKPKPWLFSYRQTRSFTSILGISGLWSAVQQCYRRRCKLVRTVLIIRAVDDALDLIGSESDGIEAGVAVHGGRVIAHIVMRQLGGAFLADPASDIDAVIPKIEISVRQHVVSLVAVFPENAYPGNLFKNQKRCSSLLKDAGLP